MKLVIQIASAFALIVVLHGAPQTKAAPSTPIPQPPVPVDLPRPQTLPALLHEPVRETRQTGDFPTVAQSGSLPHRPGQLPGAVRNRRQTNDGDASEGSVAVPIPLPLPNPEKNPRNRRQTKDVPRDEVHHEAILAVPIPQLLPETPDQEADAVRERRQAVPIPHQLPNPSQGGVVPQARERRQAVPIPHQLPNPSQGGVVPQARPYRQTGGPTGHTGNAPKGVPY